MASGSLPALGGECPDPTRGGEAGRYEHPDPGEKVWIAPRSSGRGQPRTTQLGPPTRTWRGTPLPLGSSWGRGKDPAVRRVIPGVERAPDRREVGLAERAGAGDQPEWGSTTSRISQASTGRAAPLSERGSRGSARTRSLTRA